MYRTALVSLVSFALPRTISVPSSCALVLALGCGAPDSPASTFEPDFGPGTHGSSEDGANPADDGPFGTTTSTTGGSTGDAVSDSGSTTTGDESANDSEGTGDCSPETHTCRAPAPGGWTGPVVLAEHGPLDEDWCGGHFPKLSTTVFGGLVGDDAQCSCSCSAPVGGSCTGSADVRLYPTSIPQNQQQCAVAVGPYTVPVGGTTNASASIPARSSIVPHLEAVGGICFPSATEALNDAQWSTRVDACAPDEAAGRCDDDAVCLPKRHEPFGSSFCIWTEGDVACPDETDYTSRKVFYEDYVDDRACSACECEVGDGTCDNGTITFNFAVYVGVPAQFPNTVVRPLAPGCFPPMQSPNGNDLLSISVAGGQPSWEGCSPTAASGQPAGDLQPSQPVTFCCAS